MKLLRLALLLLLAVLLPVRSGMAAAMLCPTVGVGVARTAAEAPMALDDDGNAASHAHHDAHHAAHDHHAMASEAGSDPGAADLPQKCTLCAAFCSMTPMPATGAPGLPPHDAADSPVPAPDAPPPHFATGGPERPPRAA